MKSSESIELPRRALKQPSPAIVEGGDCGACALAGVTGLSIEQIYDDYSGKREAFHKISMEQTLDELKRHEILDRVITDTPIWFDWRTLGMWGMPSWNMANQWFNYIVMAIDAGYYGIAHIDYDQKGPMASSDHIVVICGARQRLQPIKNSPGAKITQEILISCSGSSPNGEWKELNNYLSTSGGFDCSLIRPNE